MIHIEFDHSIEVAKKFLTMNSDLLKITKRGKKILAGEQDTLAVLTIAGLIRKYYVSGVNDAANEIRDITKKLCNVGIYHNIAG